MAYLDTDCPKLHAAMRMDRKAFFLENARQSWIAAKSEGNAEWMNRFERQGRKAKVELSQMLAAFKKAYGKDYKPTIRAAA